MWRFPDVDYCDINHYRQNGYVTALVYHTIQVISQITAGYAAILSRLFDFAQETELIYVDLIASNVLLDYADKEAIPRSPHTPHGEKYTFLNAPLESETKIDIRKTNDMAKRQMGSFFRGWVTYGVGK